MFESFVGEKQKMGQGLRLSEEDVGLMLAPNTTSLSFMMPSFDNKNNM